jgi:PKD repeat protein
MKHLTLCAISVYGAFLSTPSLASMFSGEPASGVAPLAVWFTHTGILTGQLMLDFGDGSSSGMNPAPTCYSCPPVQIVSHTYMSSGLYAATLTVGGQIIGTVTITVTKPDDNACLA